MLLHQTLAIVFLFCVSATWAGSFAQVVADTYALALIVEKIDYDVNKVTNSTPVAADNVPKNIDRLAATFNETLLTNADAKASNVSSAENQLVGAYTELTNALVNYTNDLEGKKPILVTFGLQRVIYLQLVTLWDSAGTFEDFVKGLVTGSDALNQLDYLGYEEGMAIVMSAQRIFYTPD